MTLEGALRLADILSGSGIGEIDIMGGEPTLLAWMPDFLEAVSKKGMSLNLSTNGGNTDMVLRLAELDPGRVHIGVSLEGSTAEEHERLTFSHNFRAAVDSIAGLVALKCDPVVKTVVSKETVRFIPQIVDLIRNIGVKRYYLIHMDIIGRDRRLAEYALSYTSFRAFYEEIRQNNPDIGIFKVNASCFNKEALPEGVRCAGGVNKLSVMPDGSVYPCNLFHRIGGFNLGNILRQDLLKIWQDPRLDLFRDIDPGSCHVVSCSNRPSCTGGCPAHGYFFHEKPDGPDIRCLS